MNQTWKTIVTVVVIAIVVGGGIYYLKQNKIQPNSNSTSQPSSVETAKTKSIDDYMNTYEKFPIELSSSQFSKLVRVFALCNDKYTPPITSEMCDRTTSLLSDAGWDDGKDHKFYFEFDSGGATYFGTFKDNILRLKEEASQKENFVVSQNTTLPISDKTYTNNELGYSIEYPGNWIVEDYSPDVLNNDVRIHPTNPDLLPVQPTATAEYIHIRLESSPLDTARKIASSQVGGNDMVESKITFAGQDAYFYSHKDSSNPGETIPTVVFRGIILEHNGKVISIYTHKYQLAEVKKALESFKF